jgi:putative membrane protein
MKHGVMYRFIVRWVVCSLGLWIAAGLLSTHISLSHSSGNDLWAVAVAGLLLALINAIIKPIVVLFSLPAILVTLGLFMIVINGFSVWLVAWLYKPLQIDSFGWAILAGVIIGLVNYLVTAILENHES